MKKKNISITEEVNCISVYRDEIEQIVDTLTDDSGSIEIEIDDFILDSVSEIDKLSIEKANSIKIKIDKPDIDVSMNKYGARIYSYKPDLVTEGLIYKVKSILEVRRKRLVEWIDKSFLKVFFLLALICLILIFLGRNQNPLLLYVGYALIGLNFVFFVPLGMFTHTNLTYSDIFLGYRKNKPSFYKRNKDEIFLGLFFLIVGAIIGKLL